MTTTAHTSVGAIIFTLPIPLPFKILFMFLSHFILDVYNEYYYEDSEPKGRLYAYGIIELILFLYLLIVLITRAPHELIYILLVPNLVDITEAFYKAYLFVQIYVDTHKITSIDKLSAFWFCHYKGWFPVDNTKIKLYHLPKVDMWITILTDSILVLIVTFII